MCGRFTQNYTWEEVYAFLAVFGAPRNLRPHYNVAPTDKVDVIRRDREGRRELVSMRWGLVPYFWKKSLKQAPASFNARAETVAEKPMFRDAFKRRRCIVPASGFFEWVRRESRMCDCPAALSGRTCRPIGSTLRGRRRGNKPSKSPRTMYLAVSRRASEPRGAGVSASFKADRG